MTFPREISSLDLPLSQQKYLFENGFQIVSEIQDEEFNSSPAISIRELTKPPKTAIASQLLKEEKLSREVNSFLENLDDLLKGILRTGSVTEFVGLPGSGRTQLCLHLSVSAQMVNYSLSGKTIYICTKSDFSVSRLKGIIDNYKEKFSFFKDYSVTDILKNIYVISITSVTELLDCLDYLNNSMEEFKNITLLVIDSITYPLRLCETNEKTSLIYSIVTKLRHLGKLYDFTVVLTNDMTTIAGSTGSEVVPSLKDTFHHLINNRILLSKNEALFEAELLKCSSKFPMTFKFEFLKDIT